MLTKSKHYSRSFSISAPFLFERAIDALACILTKGLNISRGRISLHLNLYKKNTTGRFNCL